MKGIKLRNKDAGGNHSHSHNCSDKNAHSSNIQVVCSSIKGIGNRVDRLEAQTVPNRINSVNSSKEISSRSEQNIAGFESTLTQCLNQTNSKQYFQAPFEALRTELRNESHMTQISLAVIMQAIIDSTAFGSSKATIKLRRDARCWIFGDNLDFTRTCIEGKISPEFVRRKAMALIEMTPMSPCNQNSYKNSK